VSDDSTASYPIKVSDQPILSPCSRPEDATFIYIDTSTRIQILDTVSHLPKADKEQCGAFIVSYFLFLGSALRY